MTQEEAVKLLTDKYQFQSSVDALAIGKVLEQLSDLTRERDALKEERDHYKNQLEGKEIEVKACHTAFDEISEACLNLARENARLTERLNWPDADVNEITPEK